jgi:hypothetical protein
MTGLSVLLRESIEAWAENLRQNNPLGRLAKQGQLPPHALALYLESLRYLFQQSQCNLSHAARCSEQQGDIALARYFQRKVQEEQGHDGWAASDLAKLPGAVTQGLQPARSIVALVELQRVLIARHPICFVSYALWAEYFTVLIGDEWLDALSACGYDRTQVGAIAKHVEADRDHARAGFDEIDSLWHGSPEIHVMVGVIKEAGDVFEAFCEDVCGEARRAA